VFLDGFPYLINPYLNPDGAQPSAGTVAQGVIVNFNNFVQNFNVGYDVDNMVPTGSIGLSIPNYAAHLFQSPGGNNLVQSMMQVQVFAKGYWFSPRGNTIYYRVFKGLTAHINHTDNGKTLEILIQIKGILRFLEMMQVDIHPALLSNTNRQAEILQTDQWALDPYEQIADTFCRSVTFEGFQLNTIANKGQTVAGEIYANAVAANYCVKWQSILNSILADVHIMGYLGTNLTNASINTVTAYNAARGRKADKVRSTAQSTYSTTSVTDPKRDVYVSALRGYTPDFKVATVTLINGGITPRLERIRNILHTIGFEGFQDLNGEIVFKAPLYNLDVTNLTPSPTNDATLGKSPIDSVTAATNPFVVYLDEILSESETEDEGAIQNTRMSIQGTFSRAYQVDIQGSLRAAVSHIDLPKLSHFGLREQPARTIPWVEQTDTFLMYAYAVNELVRSNRGWRTYTFTIPMRPELHIGFPMYLPHRDMYGYIKSISLNYAISGTATMTILLDTLRKRPMFPSVQQNNQSVLTTQPNLVMKWTNPPAQNSASSNSTYTGTNPLYQGTTGFLGNLLDSSSTAPSPSARSSSNAAIPSNNPSVNFMGDSPTQLLPSDAPVYAETEALADWYKNHMGTDWSTRGDTKAHSFRVQLDTDGPGGNSPYFSAANIIGPMGAATGGGVAGSTASGGNTGSTGAAQSGMTAGYFRKIVTYQPFTDEKGYEVVGVFPLGRWKSLVQAYKETREGKIGGYTSPEAAAQINSTNAALFAGLYCPSSEASSVLLQQQQTVSNELMNDSSFELEWAQPNAPGGDASLTSQAQPDNVPAAGSDAAIELALKNQLTNTVNVFLTGTPPSSPSTLQEIDIALQNNTATTTDTVVNDFKNLLKP
jgi:hypothetical protein